MTGSNKLNEAVEFASVPSADALGVWVSVDDSKEMDFVAWCIGEDERERRMDF